MASANRRADRRDSDTGGVLFVRRFPDREGAERLDESGLYRSSISSWRGSKPGNGSDPRRAPRRSVTHTKKDQTKMKNGKIRIAVFGSLPGRSWARAARVPAIRSANAFRLAVKIAATRAKSISWLSSIAPGPRSLPIWFAIAAGAAFFHVLPAYASGPKGRRAHRTSVAVGPEYDTTHIYVAPGDLDAFVTGFVATFGGSTSKRSVVNVLSVPSSTELQAVLSPVGVLSIFAYQTPVPFPFGEEHTGYLVTDMDRAIKAARAAGAEVIVAPFKDPIGIDAVIQWPGGVKMQLYWHFKPSTNPPLETIPDDRVYVSQDAANNFVRSFRRFSGGKVIDDDKHADAGEIGRAGETYRRIRISSLFGNMQVLVTDGHLPYPFGRETTGYQVRDLSATLGKARAAGVKILSPPYTVGDRTSAIVEFPGGYMAEVHSVIASKSVNRRHRRLKT
jgi:predicted enzyme related to lactoylglutathione lyase